MVHSGSRSLTCQCSEVGHRGSASLDDQTCYHPPVSQVEELYLERASFIRDS